MHIDDTASDFLTHVVETCLEFGPRRGTPIAPRVRERFPAATDEDIRAAVEQAERIQRRAGELTRAAWPLDAPEGVFQTVNEAAFDSLTAEFPLIGEAALHHAVSQAHYWHLRG